MSKAVAAAAALSVLFAVPTAARAHCDTLDGPVVQTARKALETGKVNPVLAWVRPQDEAEIKAAFARAAAVRKAGPEARALAETWFFETLVRVHRAGEGAPYTGLKPAGQEASPALEAADKAIDAGSAAAVEKLLVDAVKAGLRERFARLAAQKRPAEDVAAGRAWVAAYVPWVHYAEGLHQAASGGAEAHGTPEGGKDAHGDPAHGHGEAAPAHPHGEHR